MKKIIALIMISVLLFTFVGCSQDSDPVNEETASTSTEVTSAITSKQLTAVTPEKTTAANPAAPNVVSEWPKTVIDVLGNTLTLDKPVTSVIGTHNPTMNLAIVLGGGGKYVKGFGNKQMANELYDIVFPELADEITQIGKGKSINYETVVSLQPDLAILPERFSYLVEEFNAINVDALVMLSSSESFQSVMDSVNLMGSILSEDERAFEITAMMQDIINDVKTATAKIAEENKPAVMFLGCSSMYSVATSSLIQTEIMDAAGAVNAVTGITVYGDFADVNAENIIGWNPDIIWIPGYAKYSVEDVLNEPAFRTLTAVKKGAVYQFPSALEPWDYPTASCALGCVWAATNLYPNLYTTDDMMGTVDDFYYLLYGQTFTAEQLGVE